MKQYTLDIEDTGNIIALNVSVDGTEVTLRGTINDMRRLRDEVTRAVVCAEVWSKADEPKGDESCSTTKR